MKIGNSSSDATAVVKQFKAMVISVLMLAFSVGILLVLTSSKAWFSKNKNVSGSGMSVQADVTPNLVITNDSSLLAGLSSNASSVLCSKEDGKTAMLACTRVNSASELQYIKNPEVIAIRTGLVKSGANAPVYEYITNAEDNEKDKFYVDYTVYIASHGKPLKDMLLSAEVISAERGAYPSGNGIFEGDFNGEINTTQKAATIEFYKDEVSSSNYLGKIALADMDTAKVDLYEGDIPLNTDTESGITIVMRCYFDGALTYEDPSSGNVAYVNTYSVDTAELYIDVRFSATEAAE